MLQPTSTTSDSPNIGNRLQGWVALITILLALAEIGMTAWLIKKYKHDIPHLWVVGLLLGVFVANSSSCALTDAGRNGVLDLVVRK